MVFFMGILGFLGYEAIRVYQKLVTDAFCIPTKTNFPFYAFIIIVLSIFSGTLAYEIHPANNFHAIYIGFSVPTSLKFFSKGVNPSLNQISKDSDLIEEIEIEDMQFNEAPAKKEIVFDRIKKLRLWTSWYFS